MRLGRGVGKLAAEEEVSEGFGIVLCFGVEGYDREGGGQVRTSLSRAM